MESRTDGNRLRSLVGRSETLGLAIVVGALLACGNSSPRVAARSAHHTTAKRIAEIRQEFARKKVYGTCTEAHPEASECGLLADKYWTNENYVWFIESRCRGEDSPLCWAQFRADWYEVLFNRYTRGALSSAPNVVCMRAACPDPRQEELQLLHDHNSSIALEERLHVDIVQQAALVRRKELEIQAAKAELARRQQLQKALQGVAAGMQRAPAVTAESCRSDYECEYGRVCVKDAMAMTGVCAAKVDGSGLPKPQEADPGSFLPGEGSCSFDTECPIGFRCVKTSGGLQGNCLR